MRTIGAEERTLNRWAFAAGVLIIIALIAGWSAACFAATTIEPFFGYTHISDVMRGPPLLAPVGGCEPTTDWFGVGATVNFGKIEIDIAHGVKQRDAWCGRPYAQHRESGTELALRWYPWRKR